MAQKHGPCRTTYSDGSPCEFTAGDFLTRYCKSCRFWWALEDVDPGTRPRSMAQVGRSKGVCGVLAPDGSCTRAPHAKGMCRSHQARYAAHGDPLGGAAERFGQRVTITEAEYEALGPDVPWSGRGRRPVQLAGKTFGSLTVLQRLPGTRGASTRWVCRCSHTNSLFLVRTDSLRRRAAAVPTHRA